MDFKSKLEQIKRKDESGNTYLPFDETWNLIIEVGLTPLFDYISGVRVLSNGEKLFNNNVFMNVYSSIYDLCTQKGQYEYSSNLYEAQKAITEQFFKEICNLIMKEDNEILFMKTYLNYWNLFENVYKKWMHSFFIYVQRFYINTNKLNDIKSQLTLQFKELIFEPCKTRLMKIVADEINYYRENDNNVIIRELPQLSVMMEIFTKLSTKDESSMYTLYFENYLFDFSREYFKTKVNKWRDQNGNIEYCQIIHNFKVKEEERMKRFFESSSYSTLINIFIEESVKNIHRDILLHSEHGISFILNNQRWDDLQIFYNIMSLIPKDEGIKEFASVFGEHVSSHFMNDLTAINAENNALMNEVSAKFLQIYELYQEIVQKRLRNNSLFLDSLRNTTKNIINKVFENFKFYDAFPIYLDTILKVTGEKTGNSSDEITNIINKVIEVVNFIQDKDIFIENCRTHLAKRIYEEKIVDDEFERTLITSIKINFGNSYIIKMNGMLNDYVTSKTNLPEFKASVYNNNSFDFTPYVYTRSHWPSFPKVDIVLPRALKEAENNFVQYYEAINSKRQLTWNYTIGKMIIQVEFANNTIRDLKVNIIQGIIIYLFEDEDVQHTIESIFDRTQIPRDFIKRALHSMSCRKIKILNKTGSQEEIADNDVFTFNFNFTFPKRIVPIPCPPFEERNIQAIVKEDRSFQIDATIVRIMKSRKTLEHSILISEVLTQLRMFSPEPKLIKQRIENLIEKEYIERKADSVNVYSYIA